MIEFLTPEIYQNYPNCQSGFVSVADLYTAVVSYSAQAGMPYVDLNGNYIDLHDDVPTERLDATRNRFLDILRELDKGFCYGLTVSLNDCGVSIEQGRHRLAALMHENEEEVLIFIDPLNNGNRTIDDIIKFIS